MAPFDLANLAAYSAQVLCLAGVAGLLVTLLRVDAPNLRYRLLRGALAVCLALPWLQTPRAATAGVPGGTVRVQLAVSGAAPADAADAPAIEWSPLISALLVAGIALRFAWLAIGLARLGRLRRAGDPADPSHHSALQQALGTHADVRYIDGFAQPVTFGIRKPVVLLPASLQAHSSEIREAVLAHELLHVRRRDWAWVIAEESARALFWFHPAMWWLISRIQLAREEVVDALAVARTGRRRAYVEALMSFADDVTAGLKPTPSALAFARKRHLFRRMVLISKEDAMTARRLVLSTAAIALLTAAGGWYAVHAFPLTDSGTGQILQKTPGPLESAANPITPENPIPRRLRHEPAQYPAEAASENAWVSLTLRLTLDGAGTVGETRVTDVRVRLGDGTTSLDDDRVKRVYDAAVDAAVRAIERWRYDAPANAPVSFDITLFFSKNVTETPAAARRGFTRLADDKAIRVGGILPPPMKLKDVRPVYPPDAMDAKIQGVVIMDIRIDEQGLVSDVEILRSIPELDQAAIDAVRQWEFRPTLLNGAPTPVIVTVTIQFTLK